MHRDKVGKETKPKIIEANGESFIVHFKNDACNRGRWSGTVTQIQMFSDGTWKYQSKESSSFLDELKDARVWFEWSFCWRGMWEGRVYFKDEEYWGEDMETIPIIWKQIESILKERIKSDNPEYDFE